MLRRLVFTILILIVLALALTLLASPARSAGAQSPIIFLPLVQANNLKAIYNFTDRCDSIDLGPPGDPDLTFTWCVPKVLVYHNGDMKFYSSWNVEIYNPNVICVNKFSDVGNPNMYVTDTLGNHYDHFQVGDDAARDLCIYDGQTLTGWFLFPPAAPGATSFNFHDEDNGLFITRIRLTP